MNHLSKVWKQFEKYLKQGLDPRTLARTIALGMVLGLFPIVGTTTLICFGISIAFRLNVAIIQLANYLVYPLQLILIIPMIKLGTLIFGGPSIPNPEYFLNHSLEALKIFWVNCLFGVALWFVLSIPLFFILYYVLLRILNKTSSGC